MIGSRTPRNVKYKSDIHERMIFVSNKYSHLLSPLKVGTRVVKNRMTAANYKKHFIQGPEEYPTENVITHFVNKARNGAAIVCFPGIEFASRVPGDHYMPPYNVSNNFNQHYVCQVADGIHLYNSLCLAPLMLNLPMTVGSSFKPGEAPEFYDVSDGVLSMYIMGDPFCEMFGQHYSKPYPKEVLQDAAKLAVDQALLLKGLGIDGIIIGNTRFLSPLTNKRKDEYGGSLENRMRFIMDVCRAVKKACGKDFLISTNITVPEAQEGGWTLEDAIEACKMLEGLADIVGVYGDEIDPRHVTQFEPKMPYAEACAAIRAGIADRPNRVIIETMGGYTDPDDMESVIAEGKADLISMARAFIADPQFGKKVYEGRPDDITPCLRCNKCHRSGAHDPWIDACSVNPTWSYEHKIDRMFDAPGGVKRVGIVGGGPAGMRLAIMLTERGHKVDLYEKSERLGGLLNCADHVWFKWPLRDYKNYLIHQTYKHGVNVHLNCAPTVDQLNREEYDYVIAAVGSAPAMPPIPGIDGPNVISAVAAYDNMDKLGKRVVIVGGGEIGVETGMHLSENGHQVTVLEMTDTLAADCTPTHYRSLFIRAWTRDEDEHGLVMTTNAKVTRISPEGVTYVDADGQEHLVEADSVVISAGMKSKTDEAMTYAEAKGCFYMLGDCKKVANLMRLNQSALGIAGLI